MKKILNHAALLVLFIHPIIFFAQSGWFWQNPLPQGNYMSSLQLVNSNTAFCMTYNYVLKTTNLGFNWNIIFESANINI